jgi:arylsulfatase A-like enzyme
MSTTTRLGLSLAILGTSSLAILLPSGPIAAAPPARPNIVVIMVDDLAEMDTRVWSRLEHIDARFIRHGLRFTQAIGETPLCCPGRAAFLTGLHTDHHGVFENNGRRLDPSTTIATELRDAGYFTFIAGKYLNHTSLIRDKTPAGWDRTAITDGKYHDFTMWVNGVAERHGSSIADYSTDVTRSKALAFLRAAPARKPVFAFVTPFAPHATIPTEPFPVPARRHIGAAACNGIPRWRPPNYNERDVSDKPRYVRDRRLQPYRAGWPLTKVCESLLSVDEMFGAIVDELRRQGRLRNTLFVLTSDNGMAFGAHRFAAKNNPYAVGIPLFVSWIAGRGRAPGRTGFPVSNIDIAPTLCDVAGCIMGPFRERAAADGESFLPTIRGRDQRVRRALLERGSGTAPWWGMRTTHADPLGRWHYVEHPTGERELYDLAADPWELESLHRQARWASVEAALASRLDRLRRRWRSTSPSDGSRPRIGRGPSRSSAQERPSHDGPG